ncbi:MAG: hypothetical protein ACRDTC_23705 [Pseudonocardiaceae bacterium]
MTSTVLDLLEALRAHLTTFELPPVCVAHASIHGPDLTVQLFTDEMPELAATLLAWADTLDEPSGHAWRVPDGTSVHLSVTGRLCGGTCLRIYCGVPFTERGPGGDLQPGATAPLLLGALRHLADLGQGSDR